MNKASLGVVLPFASTDILSTGSLPGDATAITNALVSLASAAGIDDRRIRSFSVATIASGGAFILTVHHV